MSFNASLPAQGLPFAIIALLQEALALVAELKLILKQNLNLDLDVLKFKCYVPGNRLDDDQAHELFKDT